MAFKTFAPGVLTSSDVNTFLMRQAVIVCTSSTRPASPNEGMTIYETDTDQIRTYNGSAWKVTGAAPWTSFTPVIAGLGAPTVGNGTITGEYCRVGDTVHVYIRLVVGSTTTFSTTSTVFQVPSAVVPAPGSRHLGNVSYFDQSTSVYVPGACETNSGATGIALQWFITNAVGTAERWAQLTTTVQPFAFTNLDEIILSITYRTDAA